MTKPEVNMPPRIKIGPKPGRLSRWWAEVRWASEEIEFDTFRGNDGEEVEYISLEESSLRERRARREGKIEALKFANTYTDNAHAGLIAEQAEAEKELALLAERERCRREVQEARAEGMAKAFQEAFDFLIEEKVMSAKSPLAGWFRGMWEVYKDEARTAPGSGGAGGGGNL